MAEVSTKQFQLLLRFKREKIVVTPVNKFHGESLCHKNATLHFAGRTSQVTEILAVSAANV